MKQLNPLDAQFVDAEDQDGHASFAIASIAVFEGPAPAYGEFLSAIAAPAARADLPQQAAHRTVPAGAAGVGGRPELQSSLSRPAHRHPRAPR
jgi:hypothetical protein